MAYKLNLDNRVRGRRVSTVGPLVPQGPPFETMVFGGRKRNKIAYMERYQTLEEAREGHEKVVEDVRSNPSRYRLGNLFPQ